MLLRVLLRLALLGFVLWTALVAFVCVKECTVPKPDGTTQAIIVLGAQVKPDGTLSLQLQYRMELALSSTVRIRRSLSCAARRVAMSHD